MKEVEHIPLKRIIISVQKNLLLLIKYYSNYNRRHQ